MARYDSFEISGGIPVYSRYLRIFNYILLGLTAVGIFTPIFILVNIFFKTNREYTFTPFYRLPEDITNFANYIVSLHSIHRESAGGVG
jgi:ABC-type glycerol-3-phosphate transport system permease component